MMSLLPVVVTIDVADPSVSSMVATSKPFHRGLQGADGVDLGDDDARAEALGENGAALADVAVAADHATLPAIMTSVARLMPSAERLAAAVEVVEFGLGDRVVDVDGGHQELAGFSSIW